MAGNNIRSMQSRWVITGDLILLTAAHFGGRTDYISDMEIIRDAKEGTPLLPGSSIAGALRSYLADILCGYRETENTEVESVFGISRESDVGTQSPLIVFDSIGEIPEDLSTEIRDWVKIENSTGTAEKHKKFDIEVLPAGTKFPLRFDFLVENTKEEPQQIQLIASMLEGLQKGEINIGMRKSRGLGEVEVENWRVKRFDLTSESGWLEWLTSDHEKPADQIESKKSIFEAICSKITVIQIKSKTKKFVAKLNLDFPAGILIRSSSNSADAPDVVHLCSANQSILSGTSLAGALRARANRIVSLISGNQNNKIIDDIFGNNIDGRPDETPIASKLIVSESAIKNGIKARVSRIKIDRFSQGVVDGALFDEEPNYYGNTEVKLELRSPEDEEIGLIILLLKDLLTGDLPIGGASSVGRGFVRGTAEIELSGDKRIQLDPKETNNPDIYEINKYITAFINKMTPSNSNSGENNA